MAATKLNIHVQPDANPENTLRMLSTLYSNPELEFLSSKEMLEFLDEQGIGSRTELTSTATSTGLLDKTSQNISLSALGQTFVRIREEVQSDLLHFLMYTGWDAKNSLNFLQSWGYRNCCDRYWALEEFQLTSSYLDRQVEETITEAREYFDALQVSDFDEVSFSRKSLTGVHKWLLALQPQILFPNTHEAKDRVFRRRDFCPPELVTLALAWVLRDESTITGIDILLTREKREALCKVCLITPEALDRVLDWAIPTFSSVISPGTSAGFYGRFVRLHKVPTFEDIVR